MNRYPYQYVVLRCVPRVDRGEFVNVGIVVHSQAADYLGAAEHVDEERLRSVAQDVDLAAVREAVAAVVAICDGSAADERPDLDSLGRRFGWLTAPRSTVIQPGPVHSGITDDPAGTLTTLLNRLVR